MLTAVTPPAPSRDILSLHDVFHFIYFMIRYACCFALAGMRLQAL
jgi:hypothetical protein